MASQPLTRPDWRIEFGPSAQVKAGLIAVAFIGLFYTELKGLWYAWTHQMDWSHGPMIPLFSAYLVFLRWDRVRQAKITHTWVGFVLILLALAFYQYTIWGTLKSIYLRNVSMLLCLLGVVIHLCGLPVLRHIWVPWAYLLFAIPLPKGAYFALTDPLRRIAGTVSVGLVSLNPDLDVVRIGSTIQYVYNGRRGVLEVADACSGMRSTITLCALGVALTFLSDRPLWQRIIMLLSCVPIAIFANVVRVTATSMIHIYVGEQYAVGTYHTALGLGTMFLAFLIFLALGWVLSRLVVEEEVDSAAEPSRS